MTEYEMADLFISWGQYQEQMVERFIYLLFAFLITSYLVGNKIDSKMIAIVIVLYSYMALRYVFLYLNLIDDQIALASQIRASRDSQDSSLDWLNIRPTISAILYTQVAAMFLGYLASLLFLIYSRSKTRFAVRAE